MKRILSMLIAVIMVFSMIPAMTFMSLAEDVPAPDAGNMGEVGKVYVFTDGVDSSWHTVSADKPIQVVGENGAYNGEYDCVYDNASIMGFLFEVDGVQEPVTLTNNPIKAVVKTKGGETTTQVWDGSHNTAAGGDPIDADGIYLYLAQPMWWSQNGNMIFCSALKDISLAASAGCNMRVLGIVEVPQLETMESDRLTYKADLTSEIKFVDTDKATALGTQTSTIATGWAHGWSGPRVKKVEALTNEYDPAPSEDETNKYEFDGWKVVDTDASVTCALGQFTVYPSIKVTPLNAVNVTFKNGPTVLATQTVIKGETITYEGPVPSKDDDNENTYWFRGWKNEAGELVDLATYTTQTDATLTAEFTTVKKTTVALVAKEAVGFNKTGTYGIKLSRTDITLDVAGTTAAITAGSITVSCKDFTNEKGEKEFTVTFDSIDAEGLTNAEFKLVPPAGSSGVFSVDFSGSVTGADGETAELAKTTEQISTVGEQQVGKFYGESATGVPLNKNDGDAAPAEQTLWADDINFDVPYGGVSFVLKATGIETPVNISNIDPSIKTVQTNNDRYSAHWFYNNPFWGNATTSSRFMKIDKDGYYLFYINNRIYDQRPPLGVNDFRIFAGEGKDPVTNGSEETTVKNNTNDDATLQMVAVVAGDLQPTVTFHDAEGDVITSKQHLYTDLGNKVTGDGNLTKQTMELVSATEIYNSIDGAVAPVKTPEAGKEYLRYDFTGWAYEDGTPADGIYMNSDVYPVYDVVDTRPDCTILFMNGDEEFDKQIVKETEMPVLPAINPTKPSTDLYSYIFKGWDANGDGTVDELAAATVEGATYTAVYEQVDRRWEVKFYAEDKETYLGSIYVLGEIKDGTTPTAPEKPADVQYSYTFDKWVYEDGSELVESEVTQDVSVYPSYTPTLRQYTVTFQDEDGTELAKVTVDYGTAATTTEPTKAKDDLYTYTFSGWDADVSNVVGDMTVKATYSKIFTKFTDVPADEWYTKQVEYVIVHNYFSGMSNTTFEPDTVATRAMVLRVLYSAAGKPSVEGLTNPFEDVPDDEWYTPAVIWGYDVGVAYGKSETEFDPDGTVLREEFCSFIYRFAEKVYLIDGKHVDMSIPKSDTTSSLSTFKDKNDVDTWAQGSIRWCKYAGIVRGTDTDNGTFFYPLNGLTRAELATMIKGYFESDKLIALEGEQ